MDELQAGLLRVRLSHLDELTKEREVIAAYYSREIQNPLIAKPGVRPGCTSVWHQYVVCCERRDELKEYLSGFDISTLIHYPIPPHLSDAYAYLGLAKGSLPITERLAGQVLSLPIYNGMTEEELACIVKAVNSFGGNGRNA